MSSLVPLAADPSVIDRASDPGGFVVMACERAKSWLTQAVEVGDIDQIVELKSQAEAIRVYTAQKQIGHDAELAAAEIVRRAERGIGIAIRRGQEAGEIVKPNEGHFRGNQHVSPGAQPDESRTNPMHYFNGSSERSDSYIMADEATDEEFEEAIEEAKDEGNLSRANVVRKIKGEAAPSKSKGAIRDRKRRLLDLAISGHSSHQIAKELGVSAERVRHYARELEIEIPADRSVGRVRYIDPNRVIEETVIGIDGHTSALNLLEGRWSDVDLTRVDEWASSLSRSLTSLRELHKRLKELTHG